MKSFKQFIVESMDEEYEEGEEEGKKKKKEIEEVEEEEAPEQPESPGFIDTALDVGQGLLAVGGVADPTPAMDGINTGISLVRGLFAGDPAKKKEHYTNAALHGISMVPYAGDAAKAGIYGPKMAKIMASPTVAKIMSSKGLIQVADTAKGMARGRLSRGIAEY